MTKRAAAVQLMVRPTPFVRRLAFCDARVNKPGDPPNKIDLVMKRSVDGGRTWGPLHRLDQNGI